MLERSSSGFPVRVIVDANNEVGLFWYEPADTVGGEAGGHARSPAAKSRIRQLADSRSLAVPEKPWRRVGKIATPSVAGRVQISPAVVHDAPVAGTELDAVDDEVAANIERHGEGPIDVTCRSRGR